MGSYTDDNGQLRSVQEVDNRGTPRTWVTPTVGGSPQAFQVFGDGTNDLRYLRATINPDDDADAGARLMLGDVDTEILDPGESLDIYSAASVLTVYMVGIGDTTTTTPIAGELVTEAETLANFMTAMVKFTFLSADLVHVIRLKATQPYSATAAPATSANSSSVYVRGGSDV